MSGRRRKLSPHDLRRIDAWMQRKPNSNRFRLPVSAICRILRVSHNTVLDAGYRRRAYAGCARVG
jgi:hypothetical protein